MNAKKIIIQLNRAIAEKFNDFKGSYLFGSRIKNNNSDNSDYDIVAVFEKINREKKLDIYGITGKLEYNNNIFIDIKILTPEQLKWNPFFYEEVVIKGQFYDPK